MADLGGDSNWYVNWYVFTHFPFATTFSTTSRRGGGEQVEEEMLVLHWPVLLVGLLLALGQVCKSYWMVHYGRIYRFIHYIMHRRQHNIHGSGSQQHESRVWTDSEDGQLRKLYCATAASQQQLNHRQPFAVTLLSAILITQRSQYYDDCIWRRMYMAQGCNLSILLTCMES